MKRVLITGSTSGLGAALAGRYAAQGWQVITHGRAPSDGQGLHIVADLSLADAPGRLDQALHDVQVDTLDLLIHNAGVGWYGAPGEMPDAAMRAIQQTNLISPIALTHALLPRLRAANGRVAFVSSVAAGMPAPRYAAYAASKAALDAFARNLAHEHRELGVTTHWPGAMRTPMHARAGVPPELVRRAAEPQAVAAAIAHQIERGKGGAIGAANALGRLAGRFAPGLLLRAMRESPLHGALPSRGTVFITGVADGIGRALAQRYARAGWRVQGADVDAGRAQALMRELNQPLADVLAADLSSDDGVQQVIDWLQMQKPDVVIHNAGINAVGRFGDLPWERQRLVLQLNLLAPLRVARALAEQVPATQQVFISSLSRYVGYPGAAVYAATKDGVAQFAYCLAAAGLRTLTVYPGPTRTQHASRYSPDNSREARRMPPAALADAVFSAQMRGARVLIPGIGNRLFALAGTLLPGLVERAMKRALLDRLQQPLT